MWAVCGRRLGTSAPLTRLLHAAARSPPRALRLGLLLARGAALCALARPHDIARLTTLSPHPQLAAEFDRDWAHQQTLPNPSLWAALAPGSARVLTLTGGLHLISVAAQFASPLLLQEIVAGLACVPSASSSCPDVSVLYGYAALLAAASVVYNIVASHERILLAVFALRFRGKLMAAVYRKTLRLSSGALAEESAGRIVTLMSNDAQKLQEFFPTIHEIWAAPLLIAAAIWLLYQVLAWSTFIGLAVIFLLVPLTGFTAGKLFGLRRGLVALADKRVSLISEVINGMRVIKFYAWETSFAERIAAIRAEEINTVWRVAKISALFGVLLFAAPVLIGVAAIGTYSLTEGTLTAARLYTALSCFNLIRFPLVFLPFIIISFLNAKVALERLTEFLVADEAEAEESGDGGAQAAGERGRIVVSGPAEFHYPQPKPKKEDPAKEAKPVAKPDAATPDAKTAAPAESPSRADALAHSSADGLADAASVDVDSPSAPFRLVNVSLDIPPGSLVMVIGPVGSGKSTLLAALNRYLIRDAGDVTVIGSVAYVAQTAWILNATVEANILFGLAMDKPRYAAALAAAQLRPDLAILSFGDQTEIGERGVTLSGGQKQRISIARLIYAQADVNLLDDPLSAVDAHVGGALFEQCLKGCLAAKTRVLVTNALQYLPQADLIVVMEAGAVREVGTFAQLREKGTDFDALCAAHEIDADDEEPAAATDAGKKAGASARVSLDGRRASMDGRRVSMDKRTSLDKKAPVVDGAEKGSDNNLTGDESRSEGRISTEVYVTYARAAGSAAVLGVVAFSFCCEYGSKSFLDAWLGFWAADRYQWTRDNDTNFYLLVYACLFLANSLFTYVRSLLFYFFSMRACRNLHAHMLATVMRLPQSFFDSTPSGRIINRFSRDTEVLDGLLPMVLIQMTGCLFNILTTFVIISVASQWFIIALVPIFWAYLKLQRFYIPTAIELQRIESTTRSPIYSDLGEAVAGVATIRAYRRGAHFTSAADKQIYKNGNAIVTQRFASEWLNVRLRFLGTAVSTLAAFLVISGGVPAGLAGLTLVYALDVTKYMEHGTAQASEAETKMNSVERMLEYDAQPKEAPLDTPLVVAAALPQGWPLTGDLSVEKLVLRYRPELPDVLCGVSFSVSSGQKIGIVGRTGSGKSSLFMALFRMVEPVSGRVLLSGQDTSLLGLHALRREMAMIPQDPFMFGGSIRLNLDPFGEHKDEALWEALERVGLKTTVEADPKKLEMAVVDNGANFSLGQRQLLCMSRALLRNVRILMMDEATASVDLDTDVLIQRTVRDNFAACTVLTIAHRLNTIMDSDRVLVLDAGAVREYGLPSELLSKAGGDFAGLVEGTGRKNAEHLRRLASSGDLARQEAA